MIPIFIITCDRLEILKQSIQSYYDSIETPFEIVIIDFGSTYEPTVKYLKYLEHHGTKVYWQEKIEINAGLNNINNVVQDYFTKHPESNYVVTDPDVALDNVDGDILNVYSFLLEKVRGISVVGPMLRIDDIPDHYPKKKNVVANSYHTNMHGREVQAICYKGKAVRYIHAPIDSTFGMSRAGKPWVRPRKGIRVLSPYSARHLDWYLNPKNLTPDQEYYKEHASERIAHWSKWA